MKSTSDNPRKDSFRPRITPKRQIIFAILLLVLWFMIFLAIKLKWIDLSLAH